MSNTERHADIQARIDILHRSRQALIRDESIPWKSRAARAVGIAAQLEVLRYALTHS